MVTGLGCAVARPLIAAIALSGAALNTSGACSKLWPVFPSYRGPSHGFLLGTATADTVRAGPFTSAHIRRRWLPSLPSAYGQVVRIDSAGGASARGTTQAVFVPWSYDAGCRPIPRTRSARWMEPGTQGLFEAIIRDSNQWVGNMPTFDVFDIAGVPYHPPIPGYSGRLLTAHQMFDLMQRAATARDERSGLTAAINWIREHPGTASSPQAIEVVRVARDLAMMGQLKATTPVGGTYEVTANLTGRPRKTFYFRSMPVEVARGDTARAVADRLADVVPPIKSYLLEMIVSESRNMATRMPLDSASEFAPELWVWVPTAPTRASAGVRIFEARVETGTLALFGEEEDSEKTQYESPVTFRVDARGNATLEYRRLLKDGRSITFLGRRLTTATPPS